YLRRSGCAVPRVRRRTPRCGPCHPLVRRRSGRCARRWALPIGCRCSLAASQALCEVALELVDGDALLLHRVALADGDGVVVQGVEVDGHAVRGADLVLTTVAAADGAGGVVVDVPQTAQLVGDLLRGRGQGLLLRQRQDGDLHRGQARVQLEDGACVSAAL